MTQRFEQWLTPQQRAERQGITLAPWIISMQALNDCPLVCPDHDRWCEMKEEGHTGHACVLCRIEHPVGRHVLGGQ